MWLDFFFSHTLCIIFAYFEHVCYLIHSMNSQVFYASNILFIVTYILSILNCSVRSVYTMQNSKLDKTFCKNYPNKIKMKNLIMFRLKFKQNNPRMHAHQYNSMHQRLCVDVLMFAGLLFVREYLHLYMSKWINIEYAHLSEWITRAN